jgi:arsenite methyltransferase
MSAPTTLAHLILERLSWNVLPRVPEPEQIMIDPLRNTAFMEADREDGILAFIYFYQALQITPIVREGDRVLDLACGPANQLAQIARLNPRSHFVGLDASAHMLEQARTTLTGVGNVELVSGDMTRLAGIEDASMDCVICTMSLHHLPDLAALSSTMREAMRVLKRGGGLYFVDFGRFKRAGTQRFFSQDRRDCQPEPFTQDYLHSLKAAFSLKELSNAATLLGPEVKRYSTPLAPFMVVFKSPARRELDAATQQLARQLYGRLSTAQKKDFQDFARWFRAGGHGLPCALD